MTAHIRAFLEVPAVKAPKREVEERLHDWNEVELTYDPSQAAVQASRCMSCAIPFCHSKCPIGNHIPDWNSLVSREDWKRAYERLSRTNHFPEFTGRLCPAPCEHGCVVALHDAPVNIRSIELAIIERAFEEGWVRPRVPAKRLKTSVAIIGSGPAGLVAASELNGLGHHVTVFEKDEKIGGLLRYGIPSFKMEKAYLDRRIALMKAAGINFFTNIEVGKSISAQELISDFDGVILALGAQNPRNLPIEGRDLEGVVYAMDYLTAQNRALESLAKPLSAKDKNVVILGGGDTGADCLGTALRQGAKSVTQLEIMAKPPESRSDDNPWPDWARIFTRSSAHEEGGARNYALSTTKFIGSEGKIEKICAQSVEWKEKDGKKTFELIEQETLELECDLAILALGFTGPLQNGPVQELELNLTAAGNIWSDEAKMSSRPGVFVAGDCGRGQSLIVWAFAEGQNAARNAHHWLMR